MELFPAIDLRDGRCVRLVQGDYDRQTTYGDDPVAQARAFADAGADWVHVVDLDAARTGEPVNREVIGAIAAAVDVPVQTGGGVRSETAARVLADAGVARVVIGTAAVEEPSLVARVAAIVPVAVGLDVRDGEVAVRGWERGSGRTLLDVAGDLTDAGAAAMVVTDIGRDGMLEGPALDLYRELLGQVDVPIVASGGVASAADIGALAALEVDGRRLAGAILGKALYEGRTTLAEARAARDEVRA